MKRRSEVIKVGFCVAYDWHLLRVSLPLVYSFADVLCLSIDQNRHSWSGLKYEFDDNAFNNFINEIDVERKIDLYEDDFYLPELSSIENDNRQRALMAVRMGGNGWHIQIDSDEYFPKFFEFVNYLKNLIPNPTGGEKPINISCNLIPVFRRIDHGFLIVDNSKANWETMPLATNCPQYLSARRNSHFNHISPFFVLHETWARSEGQLRQKLDSWGHDNDFANKEAYISFWKSLNDSNYQSAINFHPLQPDVWHRLIFMEARGINDLLSKIKDSSVFKVNRWKLFWNNSRNIHRARKVWQKLIRAFDLF